MDFMKLTNYLSLNDIKQNEFAENIGEKPARINKYCLGVRIPRPDVMKSIFEATDGQVTPNDFYNLGTAEDVQAAAVPVNDEPKGKGNA